MTRLMALATEESVLLSVKLMWSSVSSVTSTTGSRGAAIGSRRDASAPCAASGPLYHPFRERQQPGEVTHGSREVLKLAVHVR